jgi:hypothetical protein
VKKTKKSRLPQAGRCWSAVLPICAALAWSGGARSRAAGVAPAAGDRVRPGEIEVDPPTLSCAGFAWFFSGDDNSNAVARIEFRPAGAAAWRRGPDLFRVPRSHQRPASAGGGADLFGGSLFDLPSGTDIEVRLTMDDPDGGGAVRVVTVRTWAEPRPPPPRRTLHVRPGEGGGSGTVADPLLGLAAADAAARPGDHLLLHAGTYRGGVSLGRCGTPDAPVVWTAAGDGETVIVVPPGEVGIRAPGLSHVFFEGLAFRGGARAMSVPDGRHVTIRRCRFEGAESGVWAAGGKASRVFIADCVFRGPRTWPRRDDDAELGESRGVEIGGVGSVVAWNSFSGYRDAVDTIGGPPVRGIDICHNDIRFCTDDGIELDYSDRNCRAFRNRIVDCFMGISFQPSFGGPNYAVRNVMYNLGLESFKLHLSPPGVMTAGGVLLHNSVVTREVPLRVWAPGCPVRGFAIANNIFAGYGAKAIDLICAPAALTLDGNLYAGAFPDFARLGGEPYASWEDFRRRTGLERRGRRVGDPLAPFAAMPPPPGASSSSPAPPADWRPAPDGPAIDMAIPLPGINDAFAGVAPDAGAFELGEAPPGWGPRNSGRSER